MVALPSILTFNPDDELAADIVRALAEPSGSLDAVAKARGISLADLALWLTTPNARERMLAIEQGGCAHVRMAASLHLSRAVAALLRVLDTFNALAASRPADDPLVIRAAIHANKAAYHLFRLSRIVPIDDARLARARSVIHDRAAPAGERAPRGDSPPSPTVYPAGALHDLHPAAVLKTDADSLRAIEVGGSASTSMSSPAPSSSSPSPSNPSSPSPRNSAPSEPSAFSSPASLDSLNSNLEALARTLGIDTSDIDESAPLPPEFLATLPPELAALLSETDPLHADPIWRTDPVPTPTPLGASP